jgi:hypothetical protein
VTFNRCALAAIGACLALSAAGFAAIRLMERELERMASARWD